MKLKLLVITALLICVCLSPSVSAAYYGNYTNMTFNITPSMGAQTAYQMKFILSNSSGVSGYYAPDNVVYTNGTTRPDWADVAFFDTNGISKAFWIENNTQTTNNATAWGLPDSIAVDNSSKGSWGFGNASQTASTMDFDGTFLDGDDFLSSLDGAKWDSSIGSGGSITVSGGFLKIISGNVADTSTSIIRKSAYSTVNTTTDMRINLVGGAQHFNIGNSNLASSFTKYNLISAASWSKSNFYAAQNNAGAEATTDDGALDAGDHIWTIKRNGSTTANYQKDRASAFATISSSLPTSALYLFIRSANGGGSSTSSTINVDWIFVRKSVPIEPTTSFYSTLPSGAGEPIVAAFTASVNPSTVDNVVSFTDESTGTPVTWNWTIDGSITNTTQNAAYIFSTAGTHTIDLNVTNSTGSFSNITKMQTVVNASGFSQVDLWQTGHYTKTLKITDSSTNAPIPVVVVTDSNGQSYTTTNGTAYFTEDAGAVVFYFAATGYVSKSASFIIDGDSEDTVQMVAADTTAPVYNVYPPKDVKFHITSFFGSPISNANVTIQGVTTSTGNWDWLVTLLGISLDEVAINGTAMSEVTDSNGDAVFLMLPSVKYNITTTASGYTFPTTIIAPQATEYTITANWNESWFSSGNDTLKDVNVSVSWVKYNDTYSFVNITYDDQTMTTTGGTITVYRDSVARVANASAISTMDITSSSCSNSTLVNTPTGGASYRVLVNATTTDQNIMRTFTHYFKGAPVALPGWTSETLLWLALFCVIFTAAFAGAIHSPQMAIVLCVESWVFWAIGWLDALITQFWYGETAIIGVLVLASFLAVMWNITEGKSKVKRSS